MTIELDSRDRAILRILQADGRITNSDLAEKVHLSPSACLRRVRQLEESGDAGPAGPRVAGRVRAGGAEPARDPRMSSARRRA
ncbi:MAG: winged helix-turn-helix transcriptional regulator [Thermomonas haemolytica]